MGTGAYPRELGTAKYMPLDASFGAIDIFCDRQIECRESLQLFRRAQHAHALQAEVLEDLCADAVGTQDGGTRGRRPRWLLSVEQAHAVHEVARTLVWTQNHDDARGLARPAAGRRSQRPAQTVAAYAQHVPQSLLQMHAHERRRLGIQIALDERDVHVLVDMVLVAI